MPRKINKTRAAESVAFAQASLIMASMYAMPPEVRDHLNTTKALLRTAMSHLGVKQQ